MSHLFGHIGDKTFIWAWTQENLFHVVANSNAGVLLGPDSREK